MVSIKDFDEQFVTFDISKKLYDLGFDEKCLDFFIENDKTIQRPLWQQVFKWFRKCNINITIYYGFKKYAFDILYPGNVYNRGFIYLTYEEAMYESVMKAIDIINKSKIKNK